MLNRSASALKGLPGKPDIKRYSPNFLYIPDKYAAEIPNQGTMSSANIKVLSYNVNLCSPREWTNVGMYPQNCWSLKFTVKPVLNGHSQKDQKWIFKTNYRLMQVKSFAEWEHYAILLTCIELPHAFKTFVLSIFE